MEVMDVLISFFVCSGVVLGNGYQNVLSFRDFVSYEVNPLPFLIRQCSDGSRADNDSVTLEASLPITYPDTYCRAVNRKAVKVDNHYELRVNLYNLDSWQGADWGSLGVVYNAQDENNFEFVFLK